ncbi:hypothetical protein JCM10296v2_007192 [Rhodotorula toruloides]
MSTPVETSSSGESTLADRNLADRSASASPSRVKAHKRSPHDPEYYDADAAEAEREMRDWGGDAPDLPRIPGVHSPHPADKLDKNRQPHRAPDYRMSTTRRGSIGAAGSTRPTGRTRSRSQTAWSENGFPELHLVDTAFSDAHRQLSRMSTARSRGTSTGETPHDGSDDVEQRDEQEKDLDKVEWEENDKHNPQNWSDKKKWAITILCAQATLVVTFASSSPSSATQQIAQQYSSSLEVADLTTSLFLAGYCLGPIVWAPMSEMIGRRPVFVVSLAIFGLFQIGDALAQNIWTIIIIRFLAACFASSPLTNAGGVIADIWDPVGRGKAMALFSASVFVGPVLGPIIGGYTVMNQSLRWRWIFAWIGFWSAASWILIAVFLPETYHPKLLAQRAKRLRKEDPDKHGDKYAELEKADFSIRSIVTRTLARPAIMLVVEPIVLTVTIYLSVVYGLLYGLFSVFPIIWGELRGFNPGETGLVFIAVGLGTTMGALIFVWTQRHYRELIPKWHGHPPPEERLYGAMLAGPFLIGGIFWLGWTGNYPSIHWAVPAASAILIGMSFTLVFISFLTYLVEVYLMYSASSLAANTICRSATAVAFPLFVRQMFAALGVGWACSLFGFVALAISPSPFLFYKYGWKLRQRSRFAPCLDVGLREQVKREEQERQEKEKNGGAEAV